MRGEGTECLRGEDTLHRNPCCPIPPTHICMPTRTHTCTPMRPHTHASTHALACPLARTGHIDLDSMRPNWDLTTFTARHWDLTTGHPSLYRRCPSSCCLQSLPVKSTGQLPNRCCAMPAPSVVDGCRHMLLQGKLLLQRVPPCRSLHRLAVVRAFGRQHRLGHGSLCLSKPWPWKSLSFEVVRCSSA